MKSFRRAPGAHVSLVYVFSCLCLLSTLISSAARADTTKIKVDPEAAKNYVALAGGVSPARLSKTISDLSRIQYAVPNQPAGAPVIAHSRMAGTPGGDQARAYVLAQFQQIFGAENVTEEPFQVTVPRDNGAFVQGAGLPRPLALQPLWPNLVRTSTLPAAGIDGPLIYAGRGDLRAFRGKPVEGSIVLLDFNCGLDWQNAARLGAKAIIFVEPAQIQRGEGELKFLRLPINMPRFWITRGDAALLQSAALTTPNFQAHLSCDNPWQVGTASNIIGTIKGTGPMADQNIIIESYYDSMSIVPTQAPGAESADGMAAMLELARAFKAHPPKRTVQFVACGAHFLGIQGARTFVDKHLDSWRPISTLDSVNHEVSSGSGKVIALTIIGILGVLCLLWGGSRLRTLRHPDWLSGLALVLLAGCVLLGVKVTTQNAPLPNRTNLLLFSGLDLSSQTSSVGVFYKGYFYDYREDIQSDFSDIGRTMRENAEKIGQVLGFDPATAFADGVNGANGKGWRNYLPGLFAFDSETATMAGGKGITFATTDDGRQLSDTPADTERTVNVINLASQTRLLACEYWHVLNDTNDPNAITPDSTASLMPIPTTPAWTRQGLRLGFSRLKGKVLLFDPKTNFVPDKPIPDSLAVVGNPDATMIGVRGNLVQATGNTAAFDFPGLPLVISNGS
ncbi:MAG: M28 family peptidase, partial [Armatimonadota bacterium]|nr:M28 family peptidase [Armatimonadota bacterium]